MSFPQLSIQPPFIAHRGASVYAPENTLAAFKKAKAMGATWVEFDVMLSKDNVAVVIHDEELNRTTNGMGKVADFTYAELAALDAGHWFDPTFAGEKISSLREVLIYLTELGLSANIEIKPQLGREALTVQAVIDIVTEQKLSPLISSFSLPVLKEVRKRSPKVSLGLLMGEWRSNWQSICDELNCIAVDVSHKILTPERIKEIKATGRLLLSYTVNQRALAEKLLAWGVDAIFTDDPEEMKNILSL